MNRSAGRVLATVGALLLGWAGTGGAPAAAQAAAASSSPAPISLAGSFSITAGHCRLGQPPSGSYVQLQIDGIPVPNPTSACGLLGSLYTPLQPGSQGLVTGGFQLDPVPTFNGAGDSQAGAIIKPVRYLTTDLGVATTCADQEAHPTPTGACGVGQTGNAVPALWAEPPATGGCPAGAAHWCIYGDLSALTASWSGVPIQQLLGGAGSCVADSGCLAEGVVSGPDLASSPASCQPAQTSVTCALGGTYDPATEAYRLDIHTVTPLGILPIIDTHYVLTGTFEPGPPAPGASPPATPSAACGRRPDHGGGAPAGGTKRVGDGATVGCPAGGRGGATGVREPRHRCWRPTPPSS